MARLRLLVIVLALWPAAAARGYVDRTPTLGASARSATQIVLVEVDKFSRANSAVILKKVRDLKGTTPDEPIRHQLAGPGQAIPRGILEWAQPGRRAVLFVTGKVALVCLGDMWYQADPAAEGWWRRGQDRSEMPLSYSGSVSRLAEALELMLAGKETAITALRHGVEYDAATFDTALNRTSLPGLKQLDRYKASLKMPAWVMQLVTNRAEWVLGQGTIAEQDVPAWIQKLKSLDPAVRAEAADDLRTLGPRAAAAREALLALLADDVAEVRTTAAAALARVAPDDGRALPVLAKALADPQLATRLAGTRAAGLMGPAAAPLTDALAGLLAEPDEILRALALQALATIGPPAAGARAAVLKLLEDPQFAPDAADTLGRMGPAAAEALPALAKMLTDKDRQRMWAAVRAMVQIGGPGADPVVDVLCRELETAGERDAYHIMMYFALLGPVAERALPTLQRLRNRDPFRYPMVVWCIQPDKKFPWDDNALGNVLGTLLLGQDIPRWNFESYIREIGERARPGARELARRVVLGTAGVVPGWGYQLLANFPDEALPLLTSGLGRDPATTQRVVLALGSMGRTAAPALEQVRTLRGKDTQNERLIEWCLTALGG
jgi:HEAT repeat protein